MKTIAAMILALAATAAPAQEMRGLKVDRVVLLMRHGVRPPTKSPPMPAGTAAEGWPDWPVAPGELTPHGTTAIKATGSYDRARFIEWGLLPRNGCPAPGVASIISDSDQRTIATGDAFAAALAPGCAIDHRHLAQDVTDPLFQPAASDPARARAAVLAKLGAGGTAARERTAMPLLKRIDAILCGPAKTACGLPREASALASPRQEGKPKLTGRLDRASTMAQILLLEYADGKPMRDVGWGRATAADVSALSVLHALEFDILARPHYVARANVGAIAAMMRDAMTARHGPAVGMIVGHDTQVASLGGLLDVHWCVAGFAADDPSPGGAIGFERLAAADGSRYVQAVFRSPSLAQIRAASPIAHGDTGATQTLALPGCRARGIAGLCTLDQFTKLIDRRLNGVADR